MKRYPQCRIKPGYDEKKSSKPIVPDRYITNAAGFLRRSIRAKRRMRIARTNFTSSAAGSLSKRYVFQNLKVNSGMGKNTLGIMVTAS
tara:strand:+ start:470 stop:733 length:264 start_codon:yes stop_codon:yes gene_type:complete